jgi:hypothetical protein
MQHHMWGNSIKTPCRIHAILAIGSYVLVTDNRDIYIYN